MVNMPIDMQGIYFTLRFHFVILKSDQTSFPFKIICATRVISVLRVEFSIEFPCQVMDLLIKFKVFDIREIKTALK